MNAYNQIYQTKYGTVRIICSQNQLESIYFQIIYINQNILSFGWHQNAKTTYETTETICRSWRASKVHSKRNHILTKPFLLNELRYYWQMHPANNSMTGMVLCQRKAQVSLAGCRLLQQIYICHRALRCLSHLYSRCAQLLNYGFIKGTVEIMNR